MNDLKTLFFEWRSRAIHKDKIFISDGPIDKTLWGSDQEKILFVGKEAYSGQGVKEDWDLPTYIREECKGPKYKFWWTLGYWAYAIRSTTEHSIPVFPGYREDYDPVREAVMRSAIVNIKKSDGLSYSAVENLGLYVKSDGDLIARQINLLNPKVILFCNTLSLVRDLWPEAKEVSQYVLVHGSRILIDYWHPANQYPDSVMFYALCGVYQNGLKLAKQMQNIEGEA